jgi:hypothetical protein
MVVPEKPNNEKIVATGCYLTLPKNRGGWVYFRTRSSRFITGVMTMTWPIFASGILNSGHAA